MALKEIPDRYLGTIIHFLMNFHNDTSEFNRPHIRKSFESSYILFTLLYIIIMVVGLVANIAMIRQIICHRQLCSVVHKYLACNAVNDIMKCLVIMPIALCTTLYQNWTFGSFLCDLFPMIQDIPFHATMLTFLLIAFDRYRQILYPIKPRFPFCFCLVGVWVCSIFAVLPYAVYTRYLDLEVYFGKQFKDTGICTINIEDNIEEYIRSLFIVMYVVPLTLITFLHIKTSEEIKTRRTAVLHETSNANRRETDPLTCIVTEVTNSSRKTSSIKLSVSADFQSNPCSSRTKPESHFQLGTSTETDDDQRDWAREQRIQKFISSAVTAYAICLLPLNLVRLLKHVSYETSDSSFYFDVTFIIVVLLAFIPSLTTPLLYRSYHFNNTGNNSDSSRYLRLGRTSDVSLSVYDSLKRYSRSRKTENKENVPATISESH